MECTKKKFKDSRQAKSALKSISNKEDNRDFKPCRAYACSNCGGFHLTKSLLGTNAVDFKLKFKKDWDKLLNK